MRVKFEESKSAKIPPSKKPRTFVIASGAKTLSAQPADIWAGFSNEIPQFCYDQQDPGLLHPGSCNYDALLDCWRLYPKYHAYFLEKINCIKNVTERVEHQELRHSKETKKFLLWWLEHYQRQINYVLRWLLKKDK
jgi:hypothetical protein